MSFFDKVQAAQSQREASGANRKKNASSPQYYYVEKEPTLSWDSRNFPRIQYWSSSSDNPKKVDLQAIPPPEAFQALLAARNKRDSQEDVQLQENLEANRPQMRRKVSFKGFEDFPEMEEIKSRSELLNHLKNSVKEAESRALKELGREVSSGSDTESLEEKKPHRRRKSSVHFQEPDPLHDIHIIDSNLATNEPRAARDTISTNSRKFKKKTIWVFRNGDESDEGSKFEVGPDMSFIEVKRLVGKKVLNLFGVLERKYVHRIKDNGVYIACGPEPVRFQHLPQALIRLLDEHESC